MGTVHGPALLVFFSNSQSIRIVTLRIIWWGNQPSNSFQFCIFWSPLCLKNFSSIVDFVPWLCNKCNVSSKVHPKQNKLKQTNTRKDDWFWTPTKQKLIWIVWLPFWSMTQNWPSDFSCLQCDFDIQVIVLLDNSNKDTRLLIFFHDAEVLLSYNIWSL